MASVKSIEYTLPFPFVIFSVTAGPLHVSLVTILKIRMTLYYGSVHPFKADLSELVLRGSKVGGGGPVNLS